MYLYQPHLHFPPSLHLQAPTHFLFEHTYNHLTSSLHHPCLDPTTTPSSTPPACRRCRPSTQRSLATSSAPAPPAPVCVMCAPASPLSQYSTWQPCMASKTPPTESSQRITFLVRHKSSFAANMFQAPTRPPPTSATTCLRRHPSPHATALSQSSAMQPRTG